MTCQWDVTGTQPQQPTLACYESATFNATTCQWVVTGIPLTASSSAGTILCAGGTTTITITASGGTAPYSGTGTFTVGAGTYTYTVTDSGGCSTTASVTVVDGTPLTSNTASVFAYDSYTWAVNGQTYTTSGTYTLVANCHTEILNLTIVASTGTSTVTTTATSPTNFFLNTGQLIAANVRQNGTINGTGTITVTGGGTLGGNGSVGNLLIKNDGTLSPGSSPGDLQANNVEWGVAGNYLFEVNDAAGSTGQDPGWDHLTVLGNLDITATSANPFVVHLATLSGTQAGPADNYACATTYRWPLVTVGGTITGFSANKFVVDATGFANGFTGLQFSIEQNNNSLELVAEDVTAPSIVCPDYPNPLPNPLVVNRSDATASDNCGYTLTWKINGTDPGLASVILPPGCHTIVWTATDDAGNSSTCTREVRGTSNLSLAYTGDTMVFSSGPTVTKAKVSLGASVTASGGAPNVAYSLLAVKFEVWTSAVTPSKVLEVTAPLNKSGNAGALVELSTDLTTGSTTAATYEVRAKLLQGSCHVGANEVSGLCLTVDRGSTTRRVVGGGWINNAYSKNGRGSFGFVAGYTTKVKTKLEGNSIFMLHGVKEGGVAYNWKVKDTSWSTATLSFYHNPAVTGSLVDSGRVTFKGVVQKINPLTEAVVGGFSNATVVVDVFDGGLYTPARKDQYSIKVYDSNKLLWWGSTPATTPNPGLPLGGGGSGGGNIRIFSK
jgi:hypothetical protein